VRCGITIVATAAAVIIIIAAHAGSILHHVL
jgi:hypothetical protein